MSGLTSTLTSASSRPTSTRRILGLDPGTRITGWGLVVGDSRSATLAEMGCLRPPRSAGRPLALAYLLAQLGELLERLAPDVAVVETPFTARHLGAALALAETRGALLAALGRWGGEVVEYEPARVKAAVVGHGRAEKQQVGYIVKQRLGLAALPSEDAADALALALCHLALSSAPR
jgi:crossover junction endodeoxyribonuclease RuvC